MTSSNAPPSSQGPSSRPAQGAEHSDDLQPQQRNRQTRRDKYSHSHAHSHARLHHAHNRLHNSPDLHDRKAPKNPEPIPASAPQEAPADTTHDDNAVPYYTHVIQTISLIYGTDAEGLPSIKTLAGPPATVVVDSQTGETVAAISAQNVVATPPAPAPEPAASEAPPSSDVAPPTLSAPLTTSITPETPDASSVAAVAESSDLTAAPLPLPSTASVYPPGHNNATNTPLSADPSTHSATNTTLMKAFDFSTTSLPQTTTTSRSTVLSQTTFSSFVSSSTMDLPSSTAGATGGGAGAGDEEDQAQPTGAAGGGGGNDDPLSPQEKQIVGGVVGGVAGAAFFLLLILLALRYRKRKQARLALDDNDGGMGSRGITGGGGSGGPAMSQRSSMPAAVAAAMASLTGKKKPPPEPAAGGERGFYRVSGRKLQSVLQTGGDGYTDPHASVASGNSDYYRGSQAFDPGAGASNRLALGSPMRPVSGVMVMRDGPGRTPVTEQNPFADPPTPPPARGPGTLGRSLASHDGSGASGSRFREVI